MTQITDVREAWRALAEEKVLRSYVGNLYRLSYLYVVCKRPETTVWQESTNIGADPWTVGRWCEACNAFEAECEKCPKEGGEQMLICSLASECPISGCPHHRRHLPRCDGCNWWDCVRTGITGNCIPVPAEPETEEWPVVVPNKAGYRVEVNAPGPCTYDADAMPCYFPHTFLRWVHSTGMEGKFGTDICAKWHFWADDMEAEVYDYWMPGWTHHFARAALMVKEPKQ